MSAQDTVTAHDGLGRCSNQLPQSVTKVQCCSAASAGAGLLGSQWPRDVSHQATGESPSIYPQEPPISTPASPSDDVHAAVLVGTGVSE